MNTKIHLRKELLQKRAYLSSQEQKFSSKKICHFLCEEIQKKLSREKTILFFAPHKHEVDISLCIEKCLQDSKIVCAFPRIINKDQGIFEAVKIENISELQGNSHNYGIAEPITAHVIPPEEIDLVLVPAVGVDPKGHRIGYGKGYYDRFLEKVKCPKWAPLFSCQKVENIIAVENHDIPVDAIIDEYGFKSTRN